MNAIDRLRLAIQYLNAQMSHKHRHMQAGHLVTLEDGSMWRQGRMVATPSFYRNRPIPKKKATTR